MSAKNPLETVLPIARNSNDDRVPQAPDPSYEEAAELVREGKANGIGDARRKLAENRIRDGELAEPPVTSPLLTALKSEREAREALSKAEAARAAASELQMEWEEQVKRLNMLRERTERANAELANARTQAKGAREKLFAEIGDPHSQLTIHFGVGRYAGTVGELEAGLPIIEEAVRAVESELNRHAADTRTFGKRIGIRADLLP